MLKFLPTILSILVLGGSYFVSRYNYLLFHAIVELFSIVIGVGIFVIAWNTQKYQTNGYLLFAGIAFLFIGFLDLIHMLAYKGMGVFPGITTDLPTTLWIAARYLQAISLLVASFFIGKMIRTTPVILGGILLTTALLLSIYYGVFPKTYIDGVGLTPFKIASEYLISIISIVTIINVRRNSEIVGKNTADLLIWSLIATIASEMSFTLYVDVYGFFNMLGHLFKIVAFYLIYIAMIKTNIAKPFEDLYQEIFKRERATDALEHANQELLAAKNESEQEHAKESALLASIGEGIIATDHEGKITFANHASEEILGCATGTLIGKNLVNAIVSVNEIGNPIPPEKRTLTEALLAGTTQTSNNTSFVCGGKTTPVAITATPIFLNKELIGAVEVFRDITKERELENTRRDLLSLASHQLRTPLSGTKWLIETLQKGIHGPLNEKQTEYLQEIYKINERMTQLVFDMLNVLRVESGVGAIKSELISLPKVFETILRILAPAAKNRRITIKTIYPEDATVTTDQEGLQSILENLVGNAITYSMPGTEATIEVTKDDKEVVIAIKDSGIGIPKNEQRQIFERFYRASNARTFNTRGTGLGLYIAATLAKKIGARLSFESEEGRGSTFAVHVPNKLAAGSPPQQF